MANIVINEVSANYQYNVNTASFACVAMPITACWGPAYLDIATLGITKEQMLENISWTRFPATQSGLESFVATYRGPASNYRLAKDYSYQIAMTLMTAGYDVLVCRVCPGTYAQGTFTTGDSNSFVIRAKYPGTFGNSLTVTLSKIQRKMQNNFGEVVDYTYWNIVTYVVDSSGVKTAVENLNFVFEEENSTDSLLYIKELESNFLTFVSYDGITDDSTMEETQIRLTGGDDKAAAGEASAMMDEAITLATSRYTQFGGTGDQYVSALNTVKDSSPDATTAATIRYNEWIYTNCIEVLDLLTDKLAYNFNRLIVPGWDDQDINTLLDTEDVTRLDELSPIHIKLMDVAYHSRCGTALLDIPRSLPRDAVYNESMEDNTVGYAQMLARYMPSNADLDINASLYPTHSALFAPWGQYQYTGMGKEYLASPSFQALMIQRAMILNQTLQYEWALPTNRKQNLNLGKLAYNVPKKVLDQWQSLDGVGVNAITTIPDLGTTLWGNSTLFEVPPATYQALANLSTRYLVNAVEDIIYRCGIAITFKYNNDEAYQDFQVGVSPLLDTMKNVGAIIDYRIQMSADVNGLDQVNANSVIGKVYLVIPGVVNDITVDLICLPPSVDLDTYVG